MDNKINTIDEYIASYPPEIQERMIQIRSIIRKTAPEAKEKISWGMATFVQNGNLVHFAGQKNHIGFYPGVSGVDFFKTLSADYKTTKGGIQLPNNKPLPLKLIEEVVKFRVKENK
ncbi:hypothetical protein D0T49_06090 [Paludibacter sp. 221]|uniref:iron chaperone n=1 Tax=Paludibacter sp. 221 TaxID=2302939 RepID=UPI0013D3D9BA|nr:DUF1801 domain-containing protein [Paludibacter sp. 221]NDV46613.1 hypothetical protein [Paludibacter sp. 221]